MASDDPDGHLTLDGQPDCPEQSALAPADLASAAIAVVASALATFALAPAALASAASAPAVALAPAARTISCCYS